MIIAFIIAFIITVAAATALAICYFSSVFIYQLGWVGLEAAATAEIKISDYWGIYLLRFLSLDFSLLRYKQRLAQRNNIWRLLRRIFRKILVKVFHLSLAPLSERAAP